MFDFGDAGSPETTLTKRERAKRRVSRHIKVLVSLEGFLLVNQLYTSGIEILVFDKITTQCHLLQNCF